METQNYSNHSTLRAPKTRSHQVYYASVIALNVLSIAHLCRTIMLGYGRFNAALFVLTGVALLAAYFLFRSFSLKAQDRAIRAEENLRYFVLTGKLFDQSLHIKQIVALRFAPDEELIGLAERAVKENLSNDEIKKAVINWRADHYRV